MRVLILNASPKRRGGASKLFSTLLRPFLLGCQVKTLPLHGPGDYDAALAALPWAEAVVISAPLYVDGAPSHVLPFLERAETVCREKKLGFKLYALSNNGFVEGRQNELHLRLYEGWCRRTGVTWGGGLGIGGGVMLYWLCMPFPLFALLHTVEVVMMAQSGTLTPLAVLDCYSGSLFALFFLRRADLGAGSDGPAGADPVLSLPDRRRRLYAPLCPVPRHVAPQAVQEAAIRPRHLLGGTIIYGDNLLRLEDKLLVRKMADAMGVSYTAFLIRLKELNMLEQHDVSEYITWEIGLGNEVMYP